MALDENDLSDAERLELAAARQQGRLIAELEATVMTLGAEVVILHRKIRTLRDEIQELKKARR